MRQPKNTLEQQLSLEGEFQRKLGYSADYAEGIIAFLENAAHSSLVSRFGYIASLILKKYMKNQAVDSVLIAYCAIKYIAINRKLSADIQIADFNNPTHARAIVFLLNEYAKDPMGGGEPLSAFTQANLVVEMAKRSTCHAAIAFVDGKPAGLINCIEGFSTFACKPLLNIHDVVVLAEFRGQGINSLLLNERNCHWFRLLQTDSRKF